MRVLLDACVLYPTVMREVLIGVAEAGVYQPRWSGRILEEWARATIKLGPGAEEIARGEIASLTARFPEASVRVPEGMERRFWLPDPNDAHVLAAAVAGSCDMILTLNASDFPRATLAEEGLIRQAPDEFLMHLWPGHEAVLRQVGAGVLATARRLSGEDWTIRALMKKARLPRLGKALAQGMVG